MEQRLCFSCGNWEDSCHPPSHGPRLIFSGKTLHYMSHMAFYITFIFAGKRETYLFYFYIYIYIYIYIFFLLKTVKGQTKTSFYFELKMFRYWIVFMERNSQFKQTSSMVSGDFVKSNNNNSIVYRECKKIICFTKKERVKYVFVFLFYSID